MGEDDGRGLVDVFCMRIIFEIKFMEFFFTLRRGDAGAQRSFQGGAL